ncbi:MAG: hemolysin, partial [Prevotella pectinovora]
MEERGEKQRQVSNKKEQIFLQQYHQKMEQEIIQPIDKELLKQELTPERQLRMTNKSNNEIYI